MTNNKSENEPPHLFVDDDVSSTTGRIYVDQWEKSNIENLLKEWAEKAAGLRWIHRHSASYWRTIDKRLNLIGIGIASFVSGSSLVGSVETIVDPTYIMITVGFFGMLSILNQSLMRFYNAIEKITLHETAAKGFGNLNRLISIKLSMSRAQRGSPEDFLEYVMSQNENLFNNQIEPNPVSVNAFRDEFQADDVDFSFPDIAGKTFKVDVYEAPGPVQIPLRKINTNYSIVEPPTRSLNISTNDLYKQALQPSRERVTLDGTSSPKIGVREEFI